MTETPDMTAFAASVLHLIERFIGSRPDALAQMRAQVESELASAREMLARGQAQLAAIEQLERALDEAARVDDSANEPVPAPTLSSPPLKRAILRVIEEDPARIWHRDELYTELLRRGWAPGGRNPRNTFTSRIRDLELDKQVRRVDRDEFTSVKNEGALAM